MAERDGATVHGIVAGHAAARPDAVAVRGSGQELTYRELHDAAITLAALLVERGLRPGGLVLVSTPRSPMLPVALLGVLTAGGAYIAADHRWPPARLRQAARHASMTLVVGAAAGADLPDALCLPDSVAELGARPRPGTPMPRVSDEDPCCVIFTSGTSGEPKGVLTLHGATVLRLHDPDGITFDQDTVMLQAAPLPWDGLTLELWAPLLNGGQVLLHDGSPFTPRTVRRVREDGVDTLFLTSSLFAGIVQDDVGAFGGYRRLLTGGERTPVHSVRRFLAAHPGGSLTHVYGPAEATVYITTLRVTPEEIEGLDDVPLGLPMPRTTVTVRDESLATVPDGEVGEICAGGAGLAAGYVGDKELTAARFVEVGGERLYRTGDLGWVDERHRLRFVGRKDRQVKLRGNRLELAEVESVMRRATGVVEAHAVLRTPESPRLVGHYTTVDGEERSAAVRARCVAALPAYAVPAELVHHVRLPTTVNGKVDLRALAYAPARSGRLADDPALARLQRLVAQVRGHVPSADEDLVGSGLDSLTAMRVAYRVSREFGVAFEAADLYAARTLAAVAERLPALPPLPAGEEPSTELRPTYYDWWLREQLLPGDPAALAVSAFRVTGEPVSATALAAAVRDLADRHGLLRAVFEHTPDGPRLAVRPRGSVCPVRTDDVPVDAEAGLPPHWLAPFDLEHAPAWRVRLGRDPAGAVVVGLVLHHWLVDGWAERVLITELGSAWRARENGREPTWPGPVAEAVALPPRRVPAESTERTRRFWADLLADVEELPLGAPATENVPPDVGSWRLSFVGSVAGQGGEPVAELVQARILAAWAAALAATSCEGTQLVGVAYAARDRVGEHELGCQVELIPVPVAAVPDAGHNAVEIGNTWRRALQHRSLSLPEMLAQAPGGRRHRGLQTVFALQTNERATPALGPNRTVTRLEPPTIAPLHPLTLEAWLTGDDAVTVRLEWDRYQVDEAWADALRKHLADAMPRVDFREVADGPDQAGTG